MSKCEKNKGRITIRTVTGQGETISSLFSSFLKRERGRRMENLRESLLLFHSEKIWNGYESSELFRINYSLIRFLMVM